MNKEGLATTPFLINFVRVERPLTEPRYDPETQVHKLVGTDRKNLANMTTTAIPNHRDTV